VIYNVSRFLVRLFLRLAFRYEGQGMQNVPAEGSLIICPNHVSYLDPMVVGALMERQLWYMARDTLFKNWLFGPMIRSVHAFPIKRGAVDRGAMQEFEAHVAQGHATLVFPEGTRSPDGQLQRAKPGVGMLIYRCQGARVLPVRGFGAEKAMPKGGGLRFVPIRVVYGEPLDFSAERQLPAQRETYELIAQRVMGAIAALKDPLELEKP
jgi:1-acyl-sn-glycerol-3-phosphate acyltransferase